MPPADADAEARVREALRPILQAHAVERLGLMMAGKATDDGPMWYAGKLAPLVLAAIREAYDKGCDLNEGWDYALGAAVRALSSPDTEEGW